MKPKKNQKNIKTEIWKKEANEKKGKKKEKLSNTINKNIRFRTVSHPIYFIIIYL